MTPFDLELRKHYIETRLGHLWPAYTVQVDRPPEAEEATGVFALHVMPRAGGPYDPDPTPFDLASLLDTPQKDGVVWLEEGDTTATPVIIRWRLDMEAPNGTSPYDGRHDEPPIIAEWWRPLD